MIHGPAHVLGEPTVTRSRALGAGCVRQGAPGSADQLARAPAVIQRSTAWSF